jgi:tRNA A-37 threonylcarbamoyl transferase component Bud32
MFCTYARHYKPPIQAGFQPLTCNFHRLFQENVRMIFWSSSSAVGLHHSQFPTEEELLSNAADFLFKEDPGTQLFCMPLGENRVMLKHYHYDSLFLRLRARLFASRARREYEILAQLKTLEIPTLEAVAYGEIDSGPQRLSSYLVTKFLESSLTLEAFLNLWPERRERSRVLEDVAQLVADFHAKGFFHGTLFPRNILLSKGMPCAPRVFDAPFGRFLGRPLTAQERGRDLACLLRFCHPWVSTAERGRFLRVYLGRPPGQGWGPGARSLIRATLGSAAFTRSVRKKVLFHLRRLRGIPQPQGDVGPRPPEGSGPGGMERR